MRFLKFLIIIFIFIEINLAAFLLIIYKRPKNYKITSGLELTIEGLIIDGALIIIFIGLYRLLKWKQSRNT